MWKPVTDLKYDLIPILIYLEKKIMRIQFQTEEHIFKTGGQIFRATGSSLYIQPAGRCLGHCWPIFHHNHIHKAQEHTLLKH